jgi:hypothetical protein
MKPICVTCQRFYRPETNGVRFVENMPIGGDIRSPPGRTAPHLWKPYKLWVADLWRCHGCGHELIIGAARGPLSEHYMPDFTDACEREGHLIRCSVNDC